MSGFYVELGVAVVGVVFQSAVDEVNQQGVGEDIIPAEVAKLGGILFLGEGLGVVLGEGSVGGRLLFLIYVTA